MTTELPAFPRVTRTLARALEGAGWDLEVAVRLPDTEAGASPVWRLLEPLDATSHSLAAPRLAQALEAGADACDGATLLRWPEAPPRALVLRHRARGAGQARVPEGAPDDVPAVPESALALAAPLPAGEGRGPTLAFGDTEPEANEGDPLVRGLIAALVAEGARAERAERLEESLGESVLTVDRAGRIASASPGAAGLVRHPGPLVGEAIGAVIPGWSRHEPLGGLEPAEVARGSVGGGLETTWSAQVRPELGVVLVRLHAEQEEARRPRLALVSALRHDLRAPLSAMLGLVDVMASEPDMPEVERSRMTGLLGLEVARMRDYVEDYLVTLRLRLDPRPGALRALDVARLTESALEGLRPTLPARGLHLASRLAPAEITGDPSLVEPLVRSVLGAVFKLADAGAAISVETHASGLVVRGHGPGLFDRPLDRPFTSPGRSTASGKRTPGAALGLMLARKVTDAHGWRLSVERLRGEVTVAVCWRAHVPQRAETSHIPP
jgi:signal transduction histidine kinase